MALVHRIDPVSWNIVTGIATSDAAEPAHDTNLAARNRPNPGIAHIRVSELDMAESSRQPDRAVSLEVARELAEDEVRRLGLTAKVTHHGCLQRTPMCRLFDADTLMSVGLGKGPSERALAGAYYEALERYYTTADLSPRRVLAPGSIMSAREIAGQPVLSGDQVIQRWAAEFPNEKAACHRYAGQVGAVEYPTFLVDPNYYRAPVEGDTIARYRSMLRYSASLGTAAGATWEEAVLHGLCELVEHDAVSHALLRWHFQGDHRVHAVDPSALSEELRDQLRTAEAAVGGNVAVLDVTSDLGVPAYVAVEDGVGIEYPRSGAGAAVDAGVAASRAIEELAQVANGRTRPQIAADNLSRWPVLARCVRLHATAPRIHRRHVELRSTSTPDTPEEGLEMLVEQLGRRAIPHYVAELTTPDSLIRVAATIAPELERFSLVRMGMPVLPTGRGWTAWREGTPQ